MMNVSRCFIRVNSKSRMMSSSAATQQLDLVNFKRHCRKIVGAALNFMDIVRKQNLTAPKEPLMFLKPSSSLISAPESIVIPKVFTKVAHEVELGVIIAKTCKNVTEADAMAYVGGYCLALDMTAQCALGVARANGHPWSLGKGFDTSTPVSRFIPLKEIEDPHNLPLWLSVNGCERQRGNTNDLIFNVPALIAYTSKFMTLEPYDIILTGTCAGAAPVQPGDIIECGLGQQVEQMKFIVCAEH